MDFTFTTTSDMPVQLMSPSYVPPQNADPNPSVVYVSPNLDSNCEQAALEILGLLDEVGLSSDRPIDTKDLQNKITTIIKNNIMGNTKFTFNH